MQLAPSGGNSSELRQYSGLLSQIEHNPVLSAKRAQYSVLWQTVAKLSGSEGSQVLSAQRPSTQ